jgi:hypothetical protein
MSLLLEKGNVTDWNLPQIIGAPATLARLSAWTIHQARQVLPVNGTRWIPRPLWSVIHQEVLKQCDGLDGVSRALVVQSCRLTTFRR